MSSTVNFRIYFRHQQNIRQHQSKQKKLHTEYNVKHGELAVTFCFVQPSLDDVDFNPLIRVTVHLYGCMNCALCVLLYQSALSFYRLQSTELCKVR